MFSFKNSKALSRFQRSPLFKDSFWSVFGNVIGKGLSLAAGIIVARLLGKELYGQYGLIKTTLTMIAMFSCFGLGITATKYIAEAVDRDRSQVRSIIHICYSITIFISGIIAVCILLLSNQISELIDAPQLSYVLSYASIVVVINAVNSTQTGILGGFKAYKLIARNTIYSGILTFVFTVPLTYVWGFDGAVIALILSLFANCLINSFSIYTCLPAEKGRADKSFVGSIVNFSFPIALQESSYALITWGSSFLIIKLSSYGELGILNAATQWMSVIAFVPGALRNVALSYFTSANDSIDQSHLLLKKLMLMTFVSVFVPCVLVWLFSSFICSFYGPEYSGMQRVLNVLVFTAVIASMTNMLSQELTAFGRNWYLFFTRLLRDVGILVLTALIVYHNPNGAFIYACSSLLFQLVYLILLYLKYKSIIKRMSV